MLDVTHNASYHEERKNVMALTAIHPGEHLAEELKRSEPVHAT
jgi:hypothetical protein